jgi:hypothetical protein
MAEDQTPGGGPTDQGPDDNGRTGPGWLAAFGHFWWEFLIGDTPELFIGAVAVIGVVALLSLRADLRTFAAIAAPVLVSGVLIASVYRAARKHLS